MTTVTVRFLDMELLVRSEGRTEQELEAVSNVPVVSGSIAEATIVLRFDSGEEYEYELGAWGIWYEVNGEAAIRIEGLA